MARLRLYNTGNERGGALSYALLVFLVLSVGVAVVVGYLANSRTNEQRDALERKANALAVGGMETFLAYLRAYDPSAAVSPTDYVRSYLAQQGGASGGLTFLTPEGENVTLAIVEDDFLPGTGPNALDSIVIACRAVVNGADREIKYQFQTTSKIPSLTGGGGGTAPQPSTTVTTDPNGRICVPEEPNSFYVGGTLNGASQVADQRVPVPEDRPVSTAIDEAIQAYAAQVNTEIAAMYGELVRPTSPVKPAAPSTYADCTACAAWNGNATKDAVQALIDGGNSVIRLPGSFGFNDQENIVWGSPDNPVTIIVEGGLTFNSRSNLTIHGNLFASSITFNGGGSLTVSGSWVQANQPNLHNGVPIQAGSVWVDSNLTLTDSLTVSGPIYVKNNFTANINRTITAGSIWVDGSFVTQSNVTVSGDVYVRGQLTAYSDVFDAYRIWTDGSLNTKADMTVATDIYAKGDFTTDAYVQLVFRHLYVDGNITINNGSDVHASGSVFANNKLTLNNTNSFQVENLYTKSNLTVNNGGTYNINGTVYAGPVNGTNPNQEAMTINGNTTFNAQFVLGNGRLTVNNGISLEVSGGDGKNGDLLVRSVVLNGSNTLSIPNGDFLTQTDLTVNNHLNLDAGGSFVIGGNAVMWGNIVIDTGGGTSSFLPRGVINLCAAGDPFSFNPVRVS